jgi:hypothetical protein
MSATTARTSPVRRLTTETKASFKSTEFFATVVTAPAGCDYRGSP